MSISQRTKDPSAQPHQWKKEGAIFAIHHKSTDYDPCYALNVDANYSLHKALSEIIKVFADRKTGWALPYRPEGSNGFRH